MEINSLQKINKILCFFLEDRLAKMGDRLGGLYNYYVQRLKTKEILSKEDKGIINYIQKEIPTNAKILEVGGGIGQLGHSLSYLGYFNISICEMDKQRRDACIALKKELQSNAVILDQKFPDYYHQSYDLIIIANIVNQCNDLKQDIYVLQNILRFSKVLFVPMLYDGKINYEDALSLFEKFDMQYTIIEDRLILLEGLL